MTSRIAVTEVFYDHTTREYSAWITVPSGTRPLTGFSTLTGIMSVIAELVADEAHTRPTEPALEPVRLEQP